MVDRYSHGAALIEAERLRQIEKGYDAAHDDGHEIVELVNAARAYATIAGYPFSRGYATHLWPWGAESFHPEPDTEGNLVKAGALIAAALDLIHRRAS